MVCNKVQMMDAIEGFLTLNATRLNHVEYLLNDFIVNHTLAAGQPLQRHCSFCRAMFRATHTDQRDSPILEVRWQGESIG